MNSTLKKIVNWILIQYKKDSIMRLRWMHDSYKYRNAWYEADACTRKINRLENDIERLQRE